MNLLMRTSPTSTLFIFVLFYASVIGAPVVLADTFGSGPNQFDIEFVHVGNPDNPDDPRIRSYLAGKVEYSYRMGKFEISEDMINKANTLGGLGITQSGRGANKPATLVSWFEAASFVNWLNTSTGHTPAYKFNGNRFELWQSGDAGYDPNNLFRNRQARYFLPSPALMNGTKRPTTTPVQVCTTVIPPAATMNPMASTSRGTQHSTL